VDGLVDMAETTIMSSTSGKVSSFIFETLQGYGGIHVLPDDYITKMAAHCSVCYRSLLSRGVLLGFRMLLGLKPSYRYV
jgi:adenosylmethionine-8-amino-7-oxononanoate aminotransferase